MKTNYEELIAKYDLKSGSHADIEKGACIMELVSYIADEPWSDNPQCTCPILTNYAIRLNDKFNDEHRQLLKPFIPLMIGTRADDPTQIARKQLIMWRHVTVTYPLILECYKMPELADKLRLFKNTVEDMALAANLLRDNKKQIYVNASVNVNAYADAYDNAYADAYTYAYAEAKKLRERFVEVSLETLRMAIAVKL